MKKKTKLGQGLLKGLKEILKIEMTRKEAESSGLLRCECGWPKNNHFTHGKKICAFDSKIGKKCKGYKETASIGKLV